MLYIIILGGSQAYVSKSIMHYLFIPVVFVWQRLRWQSHIVGDMFLGSTLHHSFQFICLFVFIPSSQRQKEERQTDWLHIPSFLLFSKNLHVVLQVSQPVLLSPTGQWQKVLSRTSTFVDRQVTINILVWRCLFFLRLFFMVVFEAVFPKGVQSDPVAASFSGAEQRERVEGGKEKFGWPGQVGWI